MASMRRALARLAVAWLLCEATTWALSPVVLWASESHSLECTCAHGEHAICPMHHKDSAPGVRTCVIRSADGEGVAVLTWLLTGVGLVPAGTVAAVLLVEPLPMIVDVTTASLRPPPPEPPPPRA